MEWYYLAGVEPRGPVGDTDLVALFRSGQLGATSMLRRPGMPDWLPASRVDGLPIGCLYTSVPAPPSPAPPMPPIMLPRSVASAEDATLPMLLPVRVDGFALAAGYLAFLAPLMIVALTNLPVALRAIFSIPGVLGFVLGAVALRRLRRNPSARGKVRAWMGVAVPAAVLAFMAAGLLGRQLGAF